MGFWDSVTGAISNAVSTIGKTIGKAADFVLTPISSFVAEPVKFITDPVGAEQDFRNNGFGTNATNVIKNTAIAATTLLGGEAAISAGAAGSLGTSVAIGAKTVGAAAAEELVGSVVAASPKIQTSIINTPSNLGQFGTNVGGLIQTPSISAAEKMFKDNPGLTVATATALLVALGYSSATIASIISNHFNTAAVKENTKATMNSNTNSDVPALTASPSQPTIQIINQIPNASPASTPAKKNNTPIQKPKKKKKSIHKAKKSKQKHLKRRITKNKHGRR